MHEVVDECVNVFSSLMGYDQSKVKPAQMPFIDGSKDPLAMLIEDDDFCKEDARSTGATCTSGGAQKGAMLIVEQQ